MAIDDRGEQITNQQDIFCVLKSLQLSDSQITLKITGTEHSYISSIVDVDLKKQQFMIDELSSQEGNAWVASGENFMIIAVYEGIKVILKARQVQAKNSSHMPHTFTIDFPEYIYHKQRRTAFRAVLHVNIASNVQLQSKQRSSSLLGRIKNLSTTGVGCEFEGFVRPQIIRHERFEDCYMTINDEFELNCTMVARPIAYNRLSNRSSGGFRFLALDRHQQKTVDRYVLAIQRQARKARGWEKFAAIA